MNVLDASGLGKRYGRTWAPRQCTLGIPAGRVTALVGPNGAGKTTLLNLAVGLTTPSAGAITVLGGRRAGSPAALDGIAFVAQDTPLYKGLSVADMIYVTRSLNRRFDQPYAQARLAELGIPPKRKAAKLSGGHLAAAPDRTGRRGRAAWRAGGVAVDHRHTAARRVRRRGRLPPGELAGLPEPDQQLRQQRHGRLYGQ
jgi:energy-coupling factor transporter ATP-binding protein EcfA2